MFSSPANRHLSRGSIAFYEQVQTQGVPLGLKPVGYLWLLTAAQMGKYRKPLEAMARAGVRFQILKAPELARRLPDLRLGDISRGVLGLNCGILNPNQLSAWYEKEVLGSGGRIQYGREVTGFLQDSRGQIQGVKVGEEEILSPNLVIATGPWLGRTLAQAGLKVPIIPQKRQLFAVAAREGALRRLLNTSGFNAYDLLPFTITPGGAYLRPGASHFILGYANEDQPPGLEDHPAAERDFFETRIRPQVEACFPPFQGTAPEYAWAGHYDDHPGDSTPFVERLGGALVVGGSSGSGIMKGDALGRIVAGRLLGQDWVELGDGKRFRVADLGLRERRVAPEEFVI